jgi:hypothetical protein
MPYATHMPSDWNGRINDPYRAQLTGQNAALQLQSEERRKKMAHKHRKEDPRITALRALHKRMVNTFGHKYWATQNLTVILNSKPGAV